MVGNSPEPNFVGNFVDKARVKVARSLAIESQDNSLFRNHLRTPEILSYGLPRIARIGAAANQERSATSAAIRS